jgi:peptidoglycan/xylan/chitin deacetylase (PgdA/CDA1 family)
MEGVTVAHTDESGAAGADPGVPLPRRHLLRGAAAVLAAGTATACGTPATPGHPTTAPATPSPTGATGAGAAVTSAPAAPLPAEITQGPVDRPAIALTFHGQGDPALATQLLTALERGGGRGTVLAVGGWLAASPAMAKRILSGGHELGNHTQNHLDIAGMTPGQAYTEIDTCAQLLRQLTGSIGRWFRPSQTRYSTPTIRAQATRVGYRTCLSYSIDPLDYTDPGATRVVTDTLRAVQNGSIVSLHLGHPGTVSALPGILDGLRQRGLRAVTMSELVG